MGGMPSRAMPGTYPAPPLELTINGLRGLSPSIPVPWSREIFSSSVISLTTMDARSSDDRLGFIQGCCLALDCDTAEGISNRKITNGRTNEQGESTRIRQCMGTASISLQNRYCSRPRKLLENRTNLYSKHLLPRSVQCPPTRFTLDW